MPGSIEGLGPRPWEVAAPPWTSGPLAANLSRVTDLLRRQTAVGGVAIHDRVEVATGARIARATDLRIDGHVPLCLRRYYSTSLLDGPPGGLASGWRHSFECSLSIEADRYLFRAADGAVLEFKATVGDHRSGAALLAETGGAELHWLGDRWMVSRWDPFRIDLQRYLFAVSDAQPPRLVAMANPAGQHLALAYDGQGRLSTVTQSIERRSLQFEYDGSDRIIRTFLRAPQLPEGMLVAEYRYNQRGLLELVSALRAPEAHYQYDEQGRMTTEEGLVRWTSLYDPDGRCVRLEAPGGPPARQFLYEEGGITRVIDTLEGETLYESYGKQVTLSITPCGAQAQLELDERGRPIATVGPRDERTSYEYDDRGDLVRLTTPDGGAIELAYGPDHQPASIRDLTGGAWSMQCTDGALTSFVDPLGGETAIERLSDNTVRALRTPLGASLSLVRDPDWYSAAWQGSSGLLWSEEYDHFLNVITWSAGSEPPTRFSYDERGNLAQRVDAGGATTVFGHDGGGRLVSMQVDDAPPVTWTISPAGQPFLHEDGRGHVYDHAWDAEGRLVEVRNTAAVVQTFGYDGEDRVSERHSSRTGDLQIIRPPHGRLIEVARPGAGSAIFHYDPSGRVVRVAVADQTLLGRTFDQAGHLIEVQVGQEVIRIARDPLGRPTTLVGGEVRAELRYDAGGNVVELGDQAGVRQRFDYDETGRLIRRRVGPVDEVSTFEPGGRLSLQVRGTDSARRFEYDRQGNLTRVVDTERGPTEIERDVAGRVLTIRRPAGGRQYSYDQHGQISSIDGRPAATFGAPAERSGRILVDSPTGITADPNRLYLAKAGPGAEILVQKGPHRAWLGVRVQRRPSALWIDGTCYHVLTSPLDTVVELLDADARVVWSGEFDPEGRLLQSEGLPAESVPLAMLLRDDAGPSHGLALAGGRPPWDDVGRLDDAIIGV